MDTARFCFLVAISSFAFGGCCSPEITSDSLPAGKAGTPYAFQFQAECDDGSWELVSGSPPPGLALNSAGMLGGTPTQAGTYLFTVGVGGESGSEAAAPRDFELTIGEGEVLEVTVSTNGGNPDPDGFVAMVGNVPHPIGVNETLRISGVPAGNVSVTLTGLAPNCSVLNGSMQFVTITEGEVGSVFFQVSCP